MPTEDPFAPVSAPDIEGELLVYFDTLSTSVLASTLDHSRTLRFEFDPASDTVLAMDCASDGARAAYVIGDTTTLDVRVIISDASGTREIPLQSGVVGASLSPDGTRLAYSSYLAENARGVLSILDLSNGESEAVFDKTGTIGIPGWAPDGDRIVFDGSTDPANQLYVYSAEEDSAVQVTDFEQGAFGGDWSPEGDLIVFTSYTLDGKTQLFTVSPDGGEPVQLTSTEAFKANPKWSGDGSTLAFVGTVPVPTAARLGGGSRPLPAASLHNVAVFTLAQDGSNEAPFTDLAIDAWLLNWCIAGPWLGQGWVER
jgi:dipeptidyl aminopeptidase/acylaminoacyl peptidase